MSTERLGQIAEVTKVSSIPNADKLDVIEVLSKQVIVDKGLFKVGDLCAYFRVGCYIPRQPPFNRIKGLHHIHGSNGRWDHKVIKYNLRGVASDGLAIDPKLLQPYRHTYKPRIRAIREILEGQCTPAKLRVDLEYYCGLYGKVQGKQSALYLPRPEHIPLYTPADVNDLDLDDMHWDLSLEELQWGKTFEVRHIPRGQHLCLIQERWEREITVCTTTNLLADEHPLAKQINRSPIQIPAGAAAYGVWISARSPIVKRFKGQRSGGVFLVYALYILSTKTFYGSNLAKTECKDYGLTQAPLIEESFTIGERDSRDIKAWANTEHNKLRSSHTHSILFQCKMDPRIAFEVKNKNWYQSSGRYH